MTPYISGGNEFTSCASLKSPFPCPAGPLSVKMCFRLPRFFNQLMKHLSELGKLPDRMKHPGTSPPPSARLPPSGHFEIGKVGGIGLRERKSDLFVRSRNTEDDRVSSVPRGIGSGRGMSGGRPVPSFTLEQWAGSSDNDAIKTVTKQYEISVTTSS